MDSTYDDDVLDFDPFEEDEEELSNQKSSEDQVENGTNRDNKSTNDCTSSDFNLQDGIQGGGTIATNDSFETQRETASSIDKQSDQSHIDDISIAVDNILDGINEVIKNEKESSLEMNDIPSMNNSNIDDSLRKNDALDSKIIHSELASESSAEVDESINSMNPIKNITFDLEIIDSGPEMQRVDTTFQVKDTDSNVSGDHIEEKMATVNVSPRSDAPQDDSKSYASENVDEKLIVASEYLEKMTKENDDQHESLDSGDIDANAEVDNMGSECSQVLQKLDSTHQYPTDLIDELKDGTSESQLNTISKGLYVNEFDDKSNTNSMQHTNSHDLKDTAYPCEIICKDNANNETLQLCSQIENGTDNISDMIHECSKNIAMKDQALEDSHELSNIINEVKNDASRDDSENEIGTFSKVDETSLDVTDKKQEVETSNDDAEKEIEDSKDEAEKQVEDSKEDAEKQVEDAEKEVKDSKDDAEKEVKDSKDDAEKEVKDSKDDAEKVEDSKNNAEKVEDSKNDAEKEVDDSKDAAEKVEDSKNDAEKEVEDSKDAAEKVEDSKNDAEKEVEDSKDAAEKVEDSKNEAEKQVEDSKEDAEKQVEDAEKVEDSKNDAEKEVEYSKDDAEKQVEDSKDDTEKEVKYSKDDTENEVEDSKDDTEKEVEDSKDDAEKQIEDSKEDAEKQVEDAEKEVKDSKDDAEKQIEDSKDDAEKQIEDSKDDAEIQVEDSKDAAEVKIWDCEVDAENQGKEDCKDDTVKKVEDSKYLLKDNSLGKISSCSKETSDAVQSDTQSRGDVESNSIPTSAEQSSDGRDIIAHDKDPLNEAKIENIDDNNLYFSEVGIELQLNADQTIEEFGDDANNDSITLNEDKDINSERRVGKRSRSNSGSKSEMKNDKTLKKPSVESGPVSSKSGGKLHASHVNLKEINRIIMFGDQHYKTVSSEVMDNNKAFTFASRCHVITRLGMTVKKMKNFIDDFIKENGIDVLLETLFVFTICYDDLIEESKELLDGKKIIRMKFKGEASGRTDSQWVSVAKRIVKDFKDLIFIKHPKTGADIQLTALILPMMPVFLVDKFHIYNNILQISLEALKPIENELLDMMCDIKHMRSVFEEEFLDMNVNYVNLFTSPNESIPANLIIQNDVHSLKGEEIYCNSVRRYLNQIICALIEKQPKSTFILSKFFVVADNMFGCVSEKWTQSFSQLMPIFLTCDLSLQNLPSVLSKAVHSPDSILICPPISDIITKRIVDGCDVHSEKPLLSFDREAVISPDDYVSKFMEAVKRGTRAFKSFAQIFIAPIIPGILTVPKNNVAKCNCNISETILISFQGYLRKINILLKEQCFLHNLCFFEDNHHYFRILFKMRDGKETYEDMLLRYFSKRTIDLYLMDFPHIAVKDLSKSSRMEILTHNTMSSDLSKETHSIAMMKLLNSTDEAAKEFLFCKIFIPHCSRKKVKDRLTSKRDCEEDTTEGERREKNISRYQSSKLDRQRESGSSKNRNKSPYRSGRSRRSRSRNNKSRSPTRKRIKKSPGRKRSRSVSNERSTDHSQRWNKFSLLGEDRKREMDPKDCSNNKRDYEKQTEPKPEFEQERDLRCRLTGGRFRESRVNKSRERDLRPRRSRSHERDLQSRLGPSPERDARTKYDEMESLASYDRNLINESRTRYNQNFERDNGLRKGSSEKDSRVSPGYERSRFKEDRRISPVYERSRFKEDRRISPGYERSRFKEDRRISPGYERSRVREDRRVSPGYERSGFKEDSSRTGRKSSRDRYSPRRRDQDSYNRRSRRSRSRSSRSRRSRSRSSRSRRSRSKSRNSNDREIRSNGTKGYSRNAVDEASILKADLASLAVSHNDECRYYLRVPNLHPTYMKELNLYMGKPSSLNAFSNGVPESVIRQEFTAGWVTRMQEIFEEEWQRKRRELIEAHNAKYKKSGSLDRSHSISVSSPPIRVGIKDFSSVQTHGSPINTQQAVPVIPASNLESNFVSLASSYNNPKPPTVNTQKVPSPTVDSGKDRYSPPNWEDLDDEPQSRKSPVAENFSVACAEISPENKLIEYSSSSEEDETVIADADGPNVVQILKTLNEIGSKVGPLGPAIPILLDKAKSAEINKVDPISLIDGEDLMLLEMIYLKLSSIVEASTTSFVEKIIVQEALSQLTPLIEVLKGPKKLTSAQIRKWADATYDKEIAETVMILKENVRNSGIAEDVYVVFEKVKEQHEKMKRKLDRASRIKQRKLNPKSSDSEFKPPKSSNLSTGAIDVNSLMSLDLKSLLDNVGSVISNQPKVSKLEPTQSRQNISSVVRHSSFTVPPPVLERVNRPASRTVPPTALEKLNRPPPNYMNDNVYSKTNRTSSMSGSKSSSYTSSRSTRKPRPAPITEDDLYRVGYSRTGKRSEVHNEQPSTQDRELNSHLIDHYKSHASSQKHSDLLDDLRNTLYLENSPSTSSSNYGSSSTNIPKPRESSSSSTSKLKFRIQNKGNNPWSAGSTYNEQNEHDQY